MSKICLKELQNFSRKFTLLQARGFKAFGKPSNVCCNCGGEARKNGFGKKIISLNTRLISTTSKPLQPQPEGDNALDSELELLLREDNVLRINSQKCFERTSIKSFFDGPNKQKIFHNFLEACLYSNNVPQALKAFSRRVKQFPSQNAPNNHFMLNPKTYEIILKRLYPLPQSTSLRSMFSHKHSKLYEIIQEIFKVMKRLNVTPSPLCYAYALHNLLRQKSSLGINFCIKSAQEHEISVSNILKSSKNETALQKQLREGLSHFLKTESRNNIINESDLSLNENDEKLSTLLQQFHNKPVEKGAFYVDSLNSKDFKKQFRKQIQMEKKGYFTAPSVLADEDKNQNVKKNFKMFLESIEADLLHEFDAVKRAEQYNFNTAIEYQDVARKMIYPFLSLLTSKEYVQVMISFIQSFPAGGQTTVSLSRKLGEQVYRRFIVKKMLTNESNFQNAYMEYVQLYSNHKITPTLPGEKWKEIQEKHNYVHKSEDLETWDSFWQVSVGLKMLEMILSVVRINISRGVSVPAFFNTYDLRGDKMFGMTAPHPQLQRILHQVENNLIFDIEMAPMITPPLPWVSEKEGGYLITPTKIVRNPKSGYDEELVDICLEGQAKNMNYVFEAINSISSVAWRINVPILDIQMELFRNNGDKQLEVPQPPSEGPEIPDMSNMRCLPVDERKSLRSEAFNAMKVRSEMYSLWMDGHYKLSFANMFRNDVVWLPHNMDFRGRCYPIAPHFNYMGSDMYRSLFLFDQGRPLGPKGLDWLKIHCINLSGLKKHGSIDDRLQYANEILDDIVSSADNPTAPNAWWKSSSEPWQTLATCFDIRNALQSKNPESYVSRLPVQQDGSCNGLQHYAALGKDVMGAFQVNLRPCEFPQDVYMGVAEKAEELRALEAENGKEIAKLLDGFISRKVVKQTVMTTVYGVTRYGGKLQIERRLNDVNEFPPNRASEASQYLVDQVFLCLQQMFQGARDIQEWLTKISRVVSRLQIPTEWITPLGLRVVQPYYKSQKTQISSTFQRVNVLQDTKLVNSRKQSNGVAPNFVHSLDSSHMMLTALSCLHEGMVFSSVHDCYWTHACDVAKMNKFCRQQFVNLHSQPILEDFADHLKMFLPPSKTDWKNTHLELYELLHNLPQSGNLDLEEVKDSVYFFS